MCILSLTHQNDHICEWIFDDIAVVSAVVGVICELARKNPKSYLSLAPQLFKLLTTSSNNWMLIKIIKLVSTKKKKNEKEYHEKGTHQSI